jgi:copper oxidase (laccase) domain-containing protein
VLFAAPRARGVAAAHPRWRGLAGGVLESTVHALCEAARCEPGELRAWLGACIGPGRFEVGADVLEAFGADPSRMSPRAGSPVPAAAVSAAADASDSPRFRPHAPGKWLADLPALARDRLRAAGVRDVDGGAWCTVEDASRFFSFRRDRVTGRMAAAVWIAPR